MAGCTIITHIINVFTFTQVLNQTTGFIKMMLEYSQGKQRVYTLSYKNEVSILYRKQLAIQVHREGVS